VAATLALQPRITAPSGQLVVDAQPVLTPADDNETPPVETPNAADRILLARLDALASGRSNAGAGGRLTSLGLLGALGDRDREKWEQPILVSTNVSESADNGPSPEPMTARGLLEEYLPAAQRHTNRAGASPSGDVLKLLNPLSWSEDTI
jgi:hypothetical protein